MLNAMQNLGGEPSRINPQLPSELVIDHSVQVDEYATARARFRNAELEFERNRERYAFLRWGQQAFANFEVVPPNTGICHQVNLEYLARVVESRDGAAFPDTLVGTDSHTTMVNGLGVLVEYFGPGLPSLALADRATLGNMSPEYGATCGFFPVDEVTLEYLRLTGRSEERIALVEAYCKENLLWHDPQDHPTYSRVVELDLGDVEPSLAGPRRPQDRVPLAAAKSSFIDALGTFGVEYGNSTFDKAVADSFPASDPPTFDESHEAEAA